MPYHIKRKSRLAALTGSNVDVYYTGDEGGRRWSDKYADRKVYSSDPTSEFSKVFPTTGTIKANGGWTDATAVSE